MVPFIVALLFSMACANAVIYDGVHEAKLPPWKSLAYLPQQRMNLCSAVYHGDLFVIGGESQLTNVLASTAKYIAADDRWVPSAPLRTPRAWLGCASTPTFLLAIGGQDADGKAFASTERFGANKGWVAGATLLTARSGAAVAVLDGVVIVVGGCSGVCSNQGSPKFISLKSAEKYDEANHKWVALADMTTKRANCNAAALDKTVYVFGGFHEGTWTGNYLSSVEAYTPTLNGDRWTLLPASSHLPPFFKAKTSFGVAVLNGGIFLLGGFTGGNTIAASAKFTPDAAAGGGGGTWTAASRLPVPMDNFGVAVLDGAIVVTGGIQLLGNDAAGDSQPFQVYNSTYACTGDACETLPAPSTWVAVSDLPAGPDDVGTPPGARYGHCVAAYDDALYIIGGCGNDTCTVVLDSVVRFAPAHGAWDTNLPLTKAPRAVSGCGVVRNSSGATLLFAVGGWLVEPTGGGPDASMEVLDLDGSGSGTEWLTAAYMHMHTPRMGLGVAVVGSVILAVGGCSNWTSDSWLCGTVVATTETYDVGEPHPAWTTRPASMHTARWGLAAAAFGNDVFAFGGIDANEKVLELVELFCFADCDANGGLANMWIALHTPMPHALTSFGVGVMESYIFILGGKDGTREDCNTVYRFDPRAEAWTAAAALPKAIDQIGVGVIGDEMYVTGGKQNFELKYFHAYANVYKCVGYFCNIAPTSTPTSAPSDAPSAAPTPAPTTMQPGKVAAIAVAATVGVGCVVGLAWRRWQRHAREKGRRERLLSDTLDAHAQSTLEIGMMQEAWRIDPANLVVLDFVAVGGQGRVYRGLWRGKIDCAIKVFPRIADDRASWGFSNAEVRAMQRVRGSRLVHFYGCGECLLSGNDYRPRLEEVPPGQEVDGWDFLVMVRHDFAEQILCTAFHS